MGCMTYAERARDHPNQLVRKLFGLMERKKTNLAVAADVTGMDQLLDLADRLGSKICILKMHADIIEDFDQAKIEELVEISRRHEFLILEDRKYADIGNTTKLQYAGGTHRVSKWADAVTAHAIAGEGIVRGLREGASHAAGRRGVLLISSMSSADSLIVEGSEYERKTYAIACSNQDFVMGFISQRALSTKLRGQPADFITVTPGVSVKSTMDSLGQRYRTPREAILQSMSDVVIVGRGILEAADIDAEAEKYRCLCWGAYLERIGAL